MRALQRAHFQPLRCCKIALGERWTIPQRINGISVVKKLTIINGESVR